MRDNSPEEADNSGEAHPPGGYWRKSSFSGSNGDCVEVATLARGQVGVRDSKALADPHLRFSLNAWATFVEDIRGTLTAAGRDLIP